MGFDAGWQEQNLLTRLSAEMLGRFAERGFWGDQTIYNLALGHAAANPNKLAVIDSTCRLTYGELLKLADLIAADLAASGLKAGDRVAAWMSSRAEKVAALLACSRNAYVLCPSLHRNHTTEEILGLMKRMNARAFIGEHGFGADAKSNDIFQTSFESMGVLRVFRLARPQARTATDIIGNLGLTERELQPAATDANAIVYLAFTSGTTGEPKGVMHSNNTLLSNARVLSADWLLDGSSVIYTLSPLSHNLGFGASVLTMLTGGQIVLHDLGKGESLLKRLRGVSATFIFGVPAHAMDLLDEIDREGTADLPHLKGFRISGAAVPTTVVKRLLSHGVIPQSGYGMTEAGSHHYTRPTDDADHIVTTSGKVCDGYEVAIFSIDDPDRQVGTGEIGQIGGRGASLMLGYFDDQNATQKAFNSDGWFMTGDLGRLDEDGYLQITGRIKEIIIRGGHNIHPAKIELLAMRYPSVERAAALPVKDERLGERVCIVVMPRAGSDVDPMQLLSHMHSEGLSKYDMPEYFASVSEIPLSASGKILKRALLPSFSDGSIKPVPVRWAGP